jgi:hypothetical protein
MEILALSNGDCSESNCVNQLNGWFSGSTTEN